MPQIKRDFPRWSSEELCYRKEDAKHARKRSPPERPVFQNWLNPSSIVVVVVVVVLARASFRWLPKLTAVVWQPRWWWCAFSKTIFWLWGRPRRWWWRCRIVLWNNKHAKLALILVFFESCTIELCVCVCVFKGNVCQNDETTRNANALVQHELQVNHYGIILACKFKFNRVHGSGLLICITFWVILQRMESSMESNVFAM